MQTYCNVYLSLLRTSNLFGYWQYLATIRTKLEQVGRQHICVSVHMGYSYWILLAVIRIHLNVSERMCSLRVIGGQRGVNFSKSLHWFTLVYT